MARDVPTKKYAVDEWPQTGRSIKISAEAREFAQAILEAPRGKAVVARLDGQDVKQLRRELTAALSRRLRLRVKDGLVYARVEEGV
jgi:hypothetical protein